MTDKIPLRDLSAPPAPDLTYAPVDGPALSPEQVGPGRRISLHFSLHLEDGSVVDSNYEGRPASFVFGDGSLLAGFERCLLGLRAGDEQAWVLPPEEAFGPVNEDNIQRYPRYQFPADLLPEKGLMLSFADSAGNEQAGVVVDTDRQNVTIDFNHPLAGRRIHFRALILAVAGADAEEAP